MKPNIKKWIVTILLSSVLVFGGLSIVLTPSFNFIVKLVARFAIFTGLIIWATFLVNVINKHLNNKQ